MYVMSTAYYIGISKGIININNKELYIILYLKEFLIKSIYNKQKFFLHSKVGGLSRVI